MMLDRTLRDDDILRALATVRVLSATQIASLWFPSVDAAWRRMGRLVRSRYASRTRLPNNQVVYHLPRHHAPRDIVHALGVSQVWVNLRKAGIAIDAWESPARYGVQLAPDARIQSGDRTVWLEVDRGTESWRTLRAKLQRYEAAGGGIVWLVFASDHRRAHATEKLADLALKRTQWVTAWEAIAQLPPLPTTEEPPQQQPDPATLREQFEAWGRWA